MTVTIDGPTVASCSPKKAVCRRGFRLSTMLWFYAVLASAMATFSKAEEYALAFGLLGAWLATARLVGHARPRGSRRRLALLGLVALGGGVAACSGGLTNSHAAPRVHECRGKMQRIAEALLAYRAAEGTLPPTAVQRADGGVTSWRTLLLPYLDGAADYCCPGHAFSAAPFGSSASYFAVTGPGTAWAALQSPQGVIGDDPSQTILLLEELDRGFGWDEPRDLSYEEALALLTQPVGNRYVHLSAGEPRFFEKPNPMPRAEGVNALFADGRLRFVPLPLPKAFAASLLTAHGGEPIPAARMQTLWSRECDYGKVYSFGCFVALCLLAGRGLLRLPARLGWRGIWLLRDLCAGSPAHLHGPRPERACPLPTTEAT